MTTFTVNGKTHSFNGDPEVLLPLVLRDLAGMTGTKFGCGMGSCGAARPSHCEFVNDPRKPMRI